MRKVALLTALCAMLFGAVGVAYAAVTADQGLKVVTKGKKGTKAKPSAITLSVTTTTKGNGSSPDGTFGTKQAVIHFDKNLKFNNTKFPTCDAQTVASDATKCPAGSKVGTGSADAQINPEPGLKAHPSIEAYNGPSGQFFLKLIRGSGDAVDSSGVISAKLASDTGKYGKKLIVTIPALFYYQLGLPITLQRFLTDVKATYKKTPYVVSTGCTGGKYNFGGDFTFVQVDKTTKAETTNDMSVKTTAKC
jgi:hypothetical protein